MERPTKSQMIEWGEAYWRAVQWSYPPEIRDKIHQDYIKDVLDKWERVRVMSDEEFSKEAQLSELQATLNISGRLAYAERLIKGDLEGTTGFSKGQEELDKLVDGK